MSISVKISGDGTSLWCSSEESGRDFVVNEMRTRNCHDSDEPYELVLFGPETEWVHYTDEGIEKSVNKHFVPLVQKMYPDHVVKRITWSEQGMQPENGWSFDIHSSPK
jgi:hypothetical protein